LGSGEGSIAELSRGSRSRSAGGGVAGGDHGAQPRRGLGAASERTGGEPRGWGRKLRWGKA
jgi:hypothetical protein